MYHPERAPVTVVGPADCGGAAAPGLRRYCQQRFKRGHGFAEFMPQPHGLSLIQSPGFRLGTEFGPQLPRSLVQAGCQQASAVVLPPFRVPAFQQQPVQGVVEDVILPE